MGCGETVCAYPHCTPASEALGEESGLPGRGWRFAKRAAPSLRPGGGGERVLQAALETQLSGEGVSISAAQ